MNADDPEAAISAVRLAMAYRRRFGQDVVIDLVGYRRFGHNEQDEAAYTQPLMVEQIDAHPSVRELYEEQLIDEGVLTQEEADAFVARGRGDAARSARPPEGVVRAKARRSSTTARSRARRPASGTVTAVAARHARAAERGAAARARTTSRSTRSSRSSSSAAASPIDDGGIDWGQAEALAFASLLVDGIPIRLTGQDVERGTFAQRHLVLHDHRTNETYTPMQHLDEASASFEVFNSPLSEYACVGFEYGYSAAAPGGARRSGRRSTATSRTARRS